MGGSGAVDPLKVEVPAAGGIIDVNERRLVKLVDVDGCCSTSGRWIILGGYEERSYCISLSRGVLGITASRLCVCSSQHHSIIIRPTVCVSKNSLISIIIFFHVQASL